MSEFSFPNIAVNATSGQGAFISAKRNGTTIGVSQDLTRRLELTSQHRALLAFDEDRTPWIGFVHEDDLHDPDDVGPQVKVKETTSNSIHSRPMVVQLRRYLEAGSRRRFYLAGPTETVEVQGTQATLHKLNPKGDSDE